MPETGARLRDVTVGSLFSGAGLCDLGLEWAGMKHRFFCEVDPFCRSVLRRHWPGIPIYEDVRELRGADLPPVDVLCGGFPCQDVSLAGKRKGIAKGTRSGLWHACRIWPRSGMMRSGKCFPQPRSVPRIAGSGFSLLPTPTVMSVTQSMGFYLRSPEVWEKATNLGAWLLGWEYGLTGRAARPSGKHMVDVSFAEWMMGVPQGWTAPQE